MFGGIVVHGDGYGKRLGYPTANLNISAKDTKCSPGIYAAHAVLKKQSYKSALVIDKTHNKVEVYLFDYEGGDFYGLHLDVDPIQKVSELEWYDSEEELKQKIEADVKLVREVLAD